MNSASSQADFSVMMECAPESVRCHSVNSVWVYIPQSIHRVAMTDFWRSFHHEGIINPGWWGWGSHAHPLSLYLPSRTKKFATYVSAERTDTLTLFHLNPYMYSVVHTKWTSLAGKEMALLNSSGLKSLRSFWQKLQYANIWRTLWIGGGSTFLTNFLSIAYPRIFLIIYQIIWHFLKVTINLIKLHNLLQYTKAK